MFSASRRVTGLRLTVRSSCPPPLARLSFFSPVIQPILSPSSTDPADELHYFRDANGQWHEIRGRSLAQEILRASGAETTDEKISWVDDRAVKAEEKELEFLVAGTEGRKGASVVDSGRAVTTAAPYKGMVGDERERDGRAKVVEGVAF